MGESVHAKLTKPTVAGRSLSHLSPLCSLAGTSLWEALPDSPLQGWVSLTCYYSLCASPLTGCPEALQPPCSPDCGLLHRGEADLSLYT